MNYNAAFSLTAPILDLALKQRLLGAVILVSLAILIIPALLEAPRPDLVEPVQVDEPAELAFTRLPPPDRIDPPPLPETPEPMQLEPREQWFIQVGRFENFGLAEKLRGTLRQAGYPSALHPHQTAEGTHQRVWVGPYRSQAEAEHVLHDIKAKQTLKDAHEGWVVKRP